VIWTNLSISLCVMSVFYIITSELLLAFPKLDLMRGVLAAILMALGTAGWFVGRHRARQRQRAETGSGPRPPLGLDLRYWGVMSVVLAGLSFFVQPLRHRQPADATAPTAPLTPASPPVLAEVPPPPAVTNPPVVFPALNIQGCILGKNESVVIIDGRSYGVGDQVQGLTVKSITRAGVMMEKDGQRKTYEVE